MTEQTQPWAERTVELPPEDENGFRRGVARVAPRPVPPSETGSFEVPGESGWPGPVGAQPRRPLSHQLRQLRRGSVWSASGGLFAFVCWGIWAISARGDLTSPVVTFLLSLGVAVGLFALSRLLGRVVLEGQLGRVRQTARAAHLVTGLFLVGVGVAYLRQTEWVMGVWNWFAGLW
ncbi:MAG TPA: hypothetical protein VFX61_06895 [Micromonosporaceae bacterium]|nr:hypothetical protein [Micromonosporaceae bacterium]